MVGGRRVAYFVGEAAYAPWLGWLRDVESGGIDDHKAGMQGNGWCFEVLIQNRRIAGRWLKQKADDFQGEAGKHLRSAADRYAQIAELCAKDLNTSWDLTWPSARTASANGPASCAGSRSPGSKPRANTTVMPSPRSKRPSKPKAWHCERTTRGSGCPRRRVAGVLGE